MLYLVQFVKILSSSSGQLKRNGIIPHRRKVKQPFYVKYVHNTVTLALASIVSHDDQTTSLIVMQLKIPKANQRKIKSILILIERK